MTEPKKNKAGIFLDAENITPYILLSISKRIINGSGQGNEVICHRVYGSKDTMQEQNAIYKMLCQKYRIERVVTQCPKKGKNSTDIAMAVDVIDSVYQHGLNTVYLSTNDSDFYHLAHKLQTMGVKVIGMGFKDAPKSLRNACHEFHVIKQNERKRDIVKFKQKIELKNKKSTNISQNKNIDYLTTTIDKAIKTLEFLNERSDFLPIEKLYTLTLLIDENFTLSGTKYRTITELLIDAFPEIKVDMGKEHFSIARREAHIIPLEPNAETSKEPEDLLQSVFDAHKELATTEKSFISCSELNIELTKKYSDFSIRRSGYPSYRSFFNAHSDKFEKQKVDHKILIRPKINTPNPEKCPELA